MIRYQVAERYAKALFLSQASDEVLTKRLEDLEVIRKRINENPKLLQFLYSPEAIFSEKDSFLQKVLDSDFDPLIFKFIFFLLKKKRLDCITEITKVYRQLVHNHLGILRVKVISAFALDDADKEALKLKLGKVYPNKKIAIIEKVDPKLIGGLIVVIGGRIIDFSLKHSLATMKEKLLAAPV